MLINQLEQLFESFINLINTAIDEKSPYTGGHCQRVPQLTMMLAEAVNDTREGPLADFHMTEKDRYELKIAGLLHDCGKVTTPVHVVDKATKLRDHLRPHPPHRHALRGAEARRWRSQLALQDMRCRQGELREPLARAATTTARFLHACNIGSERMRDEDVERVKRIAALPLARHRRPRGQLPAATTR